MFKSIFDEDKLKKALDQTNERLFYSAQEDLKPFRINTSVWFSYEYKEFLKEKKNVAKYIRDLIKEDFRIEKKRKRIAQVIVSHKTKRAV
jgi:hypothetical protein